MARGWSGDARNWTPISRVTLNPERDSVVNTATTNMDRQPLAACLRAPFLIFTYMSNVTYNDRVTKPQKIVLWLQNELKTPPLSSAARMEAGGMLRRLQRGELIALPHSRPMPRIGQGCHELRIPDVGKTWRIMYHLDADAVVILQVFVKTTTKTPDDVINLCKSRLRHYRTITQDKE